MGLLLTAYVALSIFFFVLYFIFRRLFSIHLNRIDNMQCDCCVAFFWLLLLVLLCGLNVNNQNTKFTFNWILYMQFEVAMERNIQECSGVSTSDESTIPPNIYFCFVILNVFSNQIQIIFYNFPPPPFFMMFAVAVSMVISRPLQIYR